MQGNEDFFGTNGTPDLKLTVINDTQIDVLSLAKILGVNISSDRKWNHRIVEVVQKVRERLFCLSQLKRAGLGPNELVQFYPTYTRPITEYACPVFMIVYLYIFLASLRRCKRQQCVSFSHVFCMKKRLLRQVLSPCQTEGKPG